MKDQQKFIDQLRNSKDPETATEGCGYFIIWADGRAQVAYKRKQDAIDFIDQDSDDPYGMEVVSVKYREAEKGERIRNKFTEASARTYKAMKKAWDNPPRDDATYPGSNVSGPVPYSVPKSPGSKPRRDQRTIEDYHAPSQLDRDPIPGDTQPEQGTGGQPHSGDLEKVDNIYPEPSNWLRPLKGLPFTDEHIIHDFNEDFDTEYHVRQRGLNMRRVKTSLNMKRAQQPPKWTDPKFLGGTLYDRVKDVLQIYTKQIRENPQLEERLVTETIPELITRERDQFISAGVTLPIMLNAIKEAANLLITHDKIALDTLHSEQAATQFYPEGPRQQTFEKPQMTMGEARLLEELTVDQIWDVARNSEIENTPESQAARGLIEKGIIANKLNMKKRSNDPFNEINRMVAQWQQTAEVVGVEEVLNIFNDRTKAYNLVMGDLRGIYSEDVAHAIAIGVIDAVPQALQTKSSKLNMKKEAKVNPKYDHGTVQTSEVSEAVTDAIKDIQGRIDKGKLHNGEDEPGWVENGIQKLFHITVLFGVNDNVKDEVKKVFDKYRPVHIETTGIEYFSSDPNYDVAIVRCKSEELTKIHDELKDTLENKETHPNYKPHITIAYLKKGEKLDDNEQITDISWEVDSLDISTSDGQLEKVSALAIPIRESLDYPHSWSKKKKKKKDKEVVTEKEKKILQMDSSKLNLKKKAQWDDEEIYGYEGVSANLIKEIYELEYKYSQTTQPNFRKFYRYELTDRLNKVLPTFTAIFVDWIAEHSDLDIPEYQNIVKVYEQLVNTSQLSLNGKIVLFHTALTTSHHTGSMADTLVSFPARRYNYDLSPEYESMAAQLLAELSEDRYIGEWNKELRREVESSRRASILDEPRASLDSAIWDIGRDDLPMLKPSVKIHIVENFLSYVAKFGGYIKPEQWVKNMFYTGSTATYKYSDKSDIDIHVIVDWIDLAALNPDKARKDPKEMREDLHNIFWWTLNKIKLPGTKHPLTYYVVPPGEEKKILEAKEEIYDIGHDVWLCPPGEVIALPQKAMSIAVEEASEIMSRIEEHLANARKGIIDYDMLKILEKLNTDSTPIILQKLDETLKALDEELVVVKDEYALLKQKRQEGFELGKPIAPSESKNYTLGNIIYKLVERYKLMNILREVKRITDAKPVEHDQVDDVADALGFEDE